MQDFAVLADIVVRRGDVVVQDETRPIPLRQLIEPWVILRLVNRESVAYLELRDSIADKGFLNSICVRPAQKSGFYEVVDGLYRWSAAKELELRVVPCIVKYNLTEDDVIALQIQANAIRPETTPVEFARQIKKIIDARPQITLAQLQAIVHKSPAWINQILGLLDLSPRNQKRLERGEMPVDNAIKLALIPFRHQPRFAPLAMTMPRNEFRVLVSAYLKRYREAAIQGTLDVAELNEFEPVPHCRSVKELQREATMCDAGAVVTMDCTPLDAWKRCLQWMLHLDSESIAVQKEKFRERAYTALITRKEPDDALDCPFLPPHLDPLTPESTIQNPLS
jgi:ParB/RepB/Spo0J family partition protein